MEKSSQRLSRADWLDHGLKSLARFGPVALKVGPLARTLGVSRGSFYWHFADIDAFHRAVLESWRARTTDAVIAYVEEEAVDTGRLVLLMQRAMSGGDRLEQAIRGWAAQVPAAAEIVGEVDRVRVDYLVKLLIAAGLAPDTARMRAQFLYWANLGRLVVGAPALQSMTPAQINALAAMLQRR